MGKRRGVEVIPQNGHYSECHYENGMAMGWYKAFMKVESFGWR